MMKLIHTEYIIDDKGKKKAVLLPLEEWDKIVEELEELEDIKAYDKAKLQPSKPIPLDKALDELE